MKMIMAEKRFFGMSWNGSISDGDLVDINVKEQATNLIKELHLIREY